MTAGTSPVGICRGWAWAGGCPLGRKMGFGEEDARCGGGGPVVRCVRSAEEETTFGKGTPRGGGPVGRAGPGGGERWPGGRVGSAAGAVRWRALC